MSTTKTFEVGAERHKYGKEAELDAEEAPNLNAGRCRREMVEARSVPRQ